MFKRTTGKGCLICRWLDYLRGIGCPLITDPVECEAVREAFEAGNPHLRPDLNISYLYFSDFRTYSESLQECSSFSGHHLATVQELDTLKPEIQANLQGCSALIWSTDNGVPVIVLVPPTGENRIYGGVSEFCRANTICIGPAD